VLLLLGLSAVLVTAARSVPGLNTGAPGLVVLLSAGQLAAHLMLSVSSHHHAGMNMGSSILGAHVAAVGVCALLVALAERIGPRCAAALSRVLPLLRPPAPIAPRLPVFPVRVESPPRPARCSPPRSAAGGHHRCDSPTHRLPAPERRNHSHHEHLASPRLRHGGHQSPPSACSPPAPHRRTSPRTARTRYKADTPCIQESLTCPTSPDHPPHGPVPGLVVALLWAASWSSKADQTRVEPAPRVVGRRVGSRQPVDGRATGPVRCRHDGSGN